MDHVVASKSSGSGSIYFSIFIGGVKISLSYFALIRDDKLSSFFFKVGDEEAHRLTLDILPPPCRERLEETFMEIESMLSIFHSMRSGKWLEVHFYFSGKASLNQLKDQITIQKMLKL